MKNTELYLKAIYFWGEQFQIDMMIEECAELTKSLLKRRRSNNLNANAHIEEEIADVEIMLEQMKLIFNADNIQLLKEEKIKRLKKLLNYT